MALAQVPPWELVGSTESKNWQPHANAPDLAITGFCSTRLLYYIT